VDVLLEGLHCSEHRLTVEQIHESITENFDHWMLPNSFSRSHPEDVLKLEEYQRTHFQATENLTSFNKTSSNIRKRGWSFENRALNYHEVKELNILAKDSYLWVLDHLKLLNISNNISSREGDYWPVAPNRITKSLDIIQSSKIGPTINELFKLDFRIDNLFFTFTNNIESYLSTHWHRDSVGNRLKFFCCLGSSGFVPSTSFIPCSLAFSPKSNNLDLVRTIKSMESDWDLQDQISHKLTTYFGSEEIRITQSKGDVFCFDTNMYHRSLIPAQAYRNARKSGKRLLLQIEMMKREASNYCAARSIGPAGPGLIPFIIKNSDKNILINQGLDKSLFYKLASKGDAEYTGYCTLNRLPLLEEVFKS